MEEYMVHIWGGAWNEGDNSKIVKDLGIESGYHYFKTKEESDRFISKLRPYRKLGLCVDTQVGLMSHKRTIAKMDLVYEGKIYPIEYDLGNEYTEECAKFYFFEGNNSCDCNKSLMIQRQVDEYFPDMNCGDDIIIENFEIIYRD